MKRIFLASRLYLCVFTITGLMSVMSMAQGADEQGRPVKIMYFQSPADAPTEAYVYVGATEIAKTKLPRNNFSETFMIPKGDMNLMFSSTQIPKGQEAPKGATVKIPKSWQKALLLVMNDPKNSVMPIRIRAINASDDEFGPGSIYMINSSEARVFGVIGKKQLELKPRSVQLFKNPTAGKGYYPVKLNAQIQGEKSSRRFIRQMWSYSDKMRHVLFVIPKKAPAYISYYGAPIRDF